MDVTGQVAVGMGYIVNGNRVTREIWNSFVLQFFYSIFLYC